MKPCNNCKRKEHCEIVRFLERSYEQSPWALDSYLNENFVNVDLVSAVSGDKDSIVLECYEYDPIKAETNYSRLTQRIPDPKPTCPPSNKCGGCKGKCGH